MQLLVRSLEETFAVSVNPNGDLNELKAAIDDCRKRGNLAQRAAHHQASGGASTEAAAAEDDGDDDDEEDAALDDALDAMLDAQMEADGNLYDDYDGGEVESD